MYYLLIILCSLLLLISQFLLIGFSPQSHFKLKYAAQSRDRNAKIVFSLHALGRNLIFSLNLFIVILSSLLTALLIFVYGWTMGVFFSVLSIYIFSRTLPNLLSQKYHSIVAAKSAPIIRFLNLLFSLPIRPFSKFMSDEKAKFVNLNFFNRQEILEIINKTKTSKETNVSVEELAILESALMFGEKKVREVMTPRKMVKTVARNEEIGPILMNELYKTGHSRFPVTSEPKNSIFVGTLYLHSLIGDKNAKKVKDLMSPQVFYIHEEQSLSHALKAFLKTHHHLFVVVNSFEEFVGVLSIEDVLEEIIGREIIDEFDQHDDLRAVAKSMAEKEKAAREDNNKIEKN